MEPALLYKGITTETSGFCRVMIAHPSAHSRDGRKLGFTELSAEKTCAPSSQPTAQDNAPSWHDEQRASKLAIFSPAWPSERHISQNRLGWNRALLEVV